MQRASIRRIAAYLAAALAASGPPALADEPTTTASIGRPSDSGLHRIEPRSPSRRPASGGSSGGWWLGTAGLALALAAFGGIGLATRRLSPAGASGRLQVIGRASLSPRHAVHLLRAGDRILMIGTGPQGAPALLGEWGESEPAEGRGGGAA